MPGKNPFSGKSVPGGTIAELNARGTNKGPIWAAQRMPWVHLSGFASSCGQYNPISSKLETASSTRYESNFARTKPVITGVEVKKQGELGTTRACTINLTAFTDQQLIELQKCYFISGMTARVQWGWSIACTGQTAPSPVMGAMDDGTAICTMQGIAGGNPAYDGLQGLITNFSYKLTNDGYWECTIDLTSAAEAVQDGKVSVHSNCDCSRVFKSEEGEDVTAKRSLLWTWLFDINAQAQNDEDCVYLGNNVGKNHERGWKVSAGNYEGEDRTDSGGSDQASLNPNYDTTEGYISWYTLEAAINTYSIPTAGGKHTIGKVMSTDLILPSHPYLDSGDPRVCVLAGSPRTAAAIGKDDWNWKQNDPGGGWTASSFDFGSTVMLNCIFLMQELKSVEDGDNKISTFLRNVLKKVSNVCGGYFSEYLEVVSTTENCNDKSDVPLVSIVDIRKYTPASIYSIPTKANNSVIRDLKLDMKLPGAMKTQAVYANGAKQNGKQTKCDGIPFRAFGVGASVIDGCRPQALQEPPCDCDQAPSSVEAEPKSFEKIFEEMYGCVDNTTTQAAIAAVAEKVNTNDDANEKCKGMPLAFDFGFTVDGVGGFAFGQLITSDRIPSTVRNNFDFQITAVEHSITAQDWTTSVSTVARFKNPG